MKILLLLLVTACSSHPVKEMAMTKEATGRFPASVDDTYVMFLSKCTMVVTNMKDGGLRNIPTDPMAITCKETSPVEAFCIFSDHNGKEIVRKSLVVAKTGSDKAIGDVADSAIVNLITRKVFSSSAIYYKDGLLRGSKLCAGDLSFASELKK